MRGASIEAAISNVHCACNSLLQNLLSTRITADDLARPDNDTLINAINYILI